MTSVLEASWFYWALALASGFRRVHVALELHAMYQSVTGDFGPNHVSVRGISLTPAGAVWWKF